MHLAMFLPEELKNEVNNKYHYDILELGKNLKLLAEANVKEHSFIKMCIGDEYNQTELGFRPKAKDLRNNDFFNEIDFKKLILREYDLEKEYGFSLADHGRMLLIC